jgi:ABC-type antimicrobial peptide transport system permease subunit
VALPIGYPLRNLAHRRLRTGLTVVVIALVVVATTLFLGLVSSLRRTLVSSGSPDNLVVLRKGSDNDGSSQLPLEAYQALRFFDGVAKDAKGEPLASPELVVQPFFFTADGGRENVLVRGVEAQALGVHDEVRVAEGRMFEPSQGEAVVGRGVASRYRGAELGQEMRFGRRHWKIVGILESGGSSFESEVWVDARDLAADAKRAIPYSGLRLKLAPGADRDALIRRIEDDSRWTLGAKPETEYYAKQAESANLFYVLVVGLAVLAGIGAVFGATNTMYAAVQARIAEIGTLRALGFPRSAVLQAFLLESIALAGLGLAVGVAIAVPLAFAVSKALGGIGFGMSTFSTSVITLRVGSFDIAIAALLALAIGVGGGLAPAWRAANLRPVEALRKG